jgi:hypothetical protein
VRTKSVVKARWARDRRGIAGSVTAVLFVIIITTLLAGVALYYVPAWSKDAESEHMNKVSNQFLSIRDGVEGQIERGTGSGSLYAHVVMTSGTTTSFLGIQGEPSKGTLALDINESLFEIYDSDNVSDIYALGKGLLRFQSRNAYYVDQEYVYEGGAVLVRQGTSSTVREGTAPRFHRIENGCLTLSLSFYAIFGEATSITGTGSAGVETRVAYTEETLIPFPAERNLTLNATTRYGAGWARFINSSILASAAAENVTSSNYSISASGDGFVFQAYGVTQLRVRFSIIEARVSK